MSRQDRVKEYANPQRGPHGAGRDQKNLDYWADCAKANSYNGGGNSGAKDTGARAKAKSDKNDLGSTFMPGVRRES
jgi:hypothetical protein